MHVHILLATAVALAAADTTTTINPATKWGTWDGWGTSLAWWAKKFGTRDDLADIFFATKSTTLGGTSLPGLGLNIVRYNAGACTWNSVNGESMVVSPKMIASRQVEGYWTDWNSSDPASASWKWSADADQRAMMAKAKARGATRFELFSNSPLWWMCRNHNPSGSDDGRSDNLQSWNVANHAVYLATIAKYAKDHWGVAFTTVEPFNEPVSGWWNGKTGTQEGCHFDGASQGPVITALRKELDGRGLGSTAVAASDENTYDLAVSTFKGLGAAALAGVGQVNVHGYQKGSGHRDTLYALASGAGKRLWNTEYGEGDATGKSLVSNLILDLRVLHPTAWVYWQVLDGGGWGLIDADNDAGTVGAVAQKYFALAQFTRHIRPGMEILDGGGDNVLAAYDAANQRLVVVAVNWGSGQNLNFDLSRFSKPSVSGAKVLRWQTKIGSGDRYVAYTNTTVSGTKFWSWFDTNTVQTFEVSNVVL